MQNEIRIMSGGQTGVDRAALDVAGKLGLARGGWCPKGRLAEDGVIDASYPLVETPSASYEQRTMWNVRDADATLIIAAHAPLTGGTRYTRTVAEGLRKPQLVVVLEEQASLAMTAEWLRRHEVRVLNVAGPRESGQPGIYRQAFTYLQALLQLWIAPMAERSTIEDNN
ncbi:MAG: putative molybdenum carrier protein [Bacteroidota bacterium]|nr:putative molybdenum carrier protein [Bacteroidota bacterium]